MTPKQKKQLQEALYLAAILFGIYFLWMAYKKIQALRYKIPPAPFTGGDGSSLTEAQAQTIANNLYTANMCNVLWGACTQEQRCEAMAAMYNIDTNDGFIWVYNLYNQKSDAGLKADLYATWGGCSPDWETKLTGRLDSLNLQ